MTRNDAQVQVLVGSALRESLFSWVDALDVAQAAGREVWWSMVCFGAPDHRSATAAALG